MPQVDVTQDLYDWALEESLRTHTHVDDVVGLALRIHKECRRNIMGVRSRALEPGEKKA